MAMKIFYDSESLFNRWFFDGFIERSDTNWRFILFTSEAFTSVRIIALQLLFPISYPFFLMRWDDYSMGFEGAWGLMGLIVSFESGDEK
jgi:hypothetical protein